MSKDKEKDKGEGVIFVNSGDHERALSDSAKNIVGGCMDLTAMALNACTEKVGGEDPLSAERYIHLADKLSQIAERLYTVGEKARANAETFYRCGNELGRIKEANK